MVAVFILILGPPVLVLGLRMLFHAFDPSSYGPAGRPSASVFSALVNPMAEFGFIIGATLGTAAGTTDLTDGMFRHLVVTGRSRLALYLARIPAGLAILLPLVAVAFTVLCLVTTFESGPQPTTIDMNGVAVPVHLNETQLRSWIDTHPHQVASAFPSGPGAELGRVSDADRHIGLLYGAYTSQETATLNPATNEMVKTGLWLELVVGVGFTAGLGIGSLTGQRTLATILMIVLQIIVTPILAANVIPYFLDGQRLIVGLALDQLRPAVLASAAGGGGGPGPGRVILGGRGTLNIPPMPTWAMISVIVGWIIGWSGIGAWKMVTRDA
jgi:hypothetical protein